MPRAGLTPQIVTRAAADLADENGWDQLTLAALATRLGVRQPSLYKHVDSLADLRQSVSLLAVTELSDRLISAVAGRAGRDALVALAVAYRRYAHAHPGRYAASVIAPDPANAEHVRAGDAILRALAAVLRGYRVGEAAGGDVVTAGSPDIDGAGAAAPDARTADASHAPPVAGDATLHAIRALRAMLHGFVALEAAGGFAMALDLDESYRRMVDGFDAALHRREPTADGAPTTGASADGAADDGAADDAAPTNRTTGSAATKSTADGASAQDPYGAASPITAR